jgi:hypothetical protein
MTQKKPQYAVDSLRKAATLLHDYVFDDPCQETAVRESAYSHAKYLRWLADWHHRELADVQRHSCEASLPRMHRMMLALAERDENAYEIVVSELGDCHECWNNLLRLAVCGHTSNSMLSVGGADKLADVMAEELERLVMG